MAAKIAKHIMEVIPDRPSGPLDAYRSRASFDWKKMKLAMEDEDIIRVKQEIFDAMAADPLFERTPWDEPTRDEERKRTLQRMKRIVEHNFVSEGKTS